MRYLRTLSFQMTSIISNREIPRMRFHSVYVYHTHPLILQRWLCATDLATDIRGKIKLQGLTCVHLLFLPIGRIV